MHQNSTREPVRLRSVPRYVWIAFVILALFTYFSGLSLPFLGPDEPRYAQVAREMFERGDWITPTLGGSNWFEKPALLYWIEILSFKLFGVSELSARLGPALFGVGTIASTWVLGRFVSRRLGWRSDLANWMALVASSTVGIMAFSHGASFDIIVTLPITASLISFFIFDRSDPSSSTTRSAALVSFYIFVGFGLLAKGLIGIVFPIAVVGVYHILVRRAPSGTLLLSLIWGTLISIAIASTWYLPMYWVHGDGFIREFFVEHHFERFTTDRYRHAQPFYYYFWVFPIGLLPWFPIAIAAMVDQRSSPANLLPNEKDKTIITDLIKFSFAWIIVIVGFFTFSGSKLPGYILPAVPAASILCSLVIYRILVAKRVWLVFVMVTAATTLVASILAIYLVLPQVARADSVRELIEIANVAGYSEDRVAGLTTVSHNAEFYAAGRLLRDTEGKQRVLTGADELIDEIRSMPSDRLLVLVPLARLNDLLDDTRVTTEVLGNNGVLAIAVVRESPARPLPFRSGP